MGAQLQAAWDVRPGTEQEYVAWINRIHVPFWRSQPGCLAIRGFERLVGTGPTIVGEFDFERLEDLQGLLASAGYQEILAGLLGFVSNYESRILVSTGRGDAYVLPPAAGANRS